MKRKRQTKDRYQMARRLHGSHAALATKTDSPPLCFNSEVLLFSSELLPFSFRRIVSIFFTRTVAIFFRRVAKGSVYHLVEDRRPSWDTDDELTTLMLF